MKKFIGLIIVLNIVLFSLYSNTQPDNQTGIGFNFHGSTILFDDFIAWGDKQSRGETNWSEYTSCTGSASTETGTSLTLLRNRPGIISLYSGNTATSYSCLNKDNDAVILGGNTAAGTGEVYYETAVYIDVLSDGTDRFTTKVGFSDDMDCTGTANNALLVSYVDNVNSGAWVCSASNVVSATPTTTSANTTVTVVADTWYTIRFRVAPDASFVQVYINDDFNPSCTLTANIPSKGDDAGPMTPFYSITNSAGTDTNRRLLVDYSYLKQSFDTLR